MLFISLLEFNNLYWFYAALKFGSEAWILKKREEQRLEAAQMKFLRHLLGITKLDKENNQCIRQKTGAQNIVKEIKQYQEKWLQHVQRMDTNRLPKQALQHKPKGRRNHRTTEEEMEGPTSSWGSRNRITCLTLQEHDDDDEWFNDRRLFVCKIPSLIWREELFDKKGVRKIFVVKWEEVREDWKSLRNWTLTVCVFDLTGQGFQIQNLSRPNEWFLNATKSTGKKTWYF